MYDEMKDTEQQSEAEVQNVIRNFRSIPLSASYQERQATIARQKLIRKIKKKGEVEMN